jgi:5-methylcytosine-specific restriction endonuclease McrA
MSQRERSLSKPERERLGGDAYKQLIERVFQRDKWTCRNPFCQSMESLTPHHVQKRSQLGGDEMGNLLTLCVRCHSAVERNELKIEIVDVVAKFKVQNGERAL